MFSKNRWSQLDQTSKSKWYFSYASCGKCRPIQFNEPSQAVSIKKYFFFFVKELNCVDKDSLSHINSETLSIINPYDNDFMKVRLFNTF